MDWLQFCMKYYIYLIHLPMIIKLHTPLTYARHKEVKAAKPASLKARVAADRWVMLILLLMAITSAIIFA